MAVTVNFTGTPLTGAEPLSVAFTLTATITPAVQARGGEWTGKKKRRYPKPYYYYQQAYLETLKDVAEPADTDTFDATIQAAAEINRVIGRLDADDHDYDSMIRQFDRMQSQAIGYIKSAKVQRQIDATRDFIEQARTAEISRLLDEQEKAEGEELLALLDADGR